MTTIARRTEESLAHEVWHRDGSISYKSGLKLNIGCGNFPADLPWLNVDIAHNAEVQPELVADVRDLPAGLQGLGAVYCGHVLEHLPAADVGPALAELRERMRSGAPILVVGPDTNRARAMFAAGELDEETLAATHAGGERWQGDKHHWDCHEALVVDLLREAGFTDVTPLAITDPYLDDWPVTSRIGWQCAVRATA